MLRESTYHCRGVLGTAKDKCKLMAGRWASFPDTSVERTDQGVVLNNDVTGETLEYLQVEHNLECWFGAELMNEFGCDDVAGMRTLLNKKWNLFWVTPRDNRMLAVVSRELVKAFRAERSLPDVMPRWGAMPGLRWGDADPSSKAQVLAYLLHGFSEFEKRLSFDITPNIDGFQDIVSRLCVFVKDQLAMLPQDAADGCYQCIPLARVGAEFLAFEAARTYAREQNIGTAAEWQTWSKSTERPPQIPSNPNQKYAGEGWVSWKDWLGTEFLAFDAARTRARKLEIRTMREWRARSKSKRLPPQLPSNPNQKYAREGWAGWKDWLGIDVLAFDAARTRARKLEIRTVREWKARSKSKRLPPQLPTNPNQKYAREGWAGWKDWLGIDVLAFDAARTRARKLEIRTVREWKARSKSKRLPPQLPTNPNQKYAREGWAGWKDWLGTDGKRGKDERVPAGVCKK
eukprot:g1782.t1